MQTIKTGPVNDEFTLMGGPELRYTPMGDAEIVFHITTEADEIYNAYATGGADQMEDWIERNLEKYTNGSNIRIEGEWGARKGMDNRQHNYIKILKVTFNG